MKEGTYKFLMILAVYIAIALFCFAIMLLAKNIQEIKQDPLVYGMEKHAFRSCTCHGIEYGIVEITLDEYKIDEIKLRD